ncbi:unnamed protein product [Linum tenue]|uniref:Uncharacterized protein n=1 Tax=Linum tenue TaxID=586396 RepID=A0AAV0LNZ6_9ROSI|nr:unnamed protein product [Linum tenue]
MTLKSRVQNWKLRFSVRFRKMMKCMRSVEQLGVDDMAASSSESLATRDYSASGYSSRAAEVDSKLDNSNIEEAESSLRESGFLNYEEARALLGRLEYQKGNIEGALHVFEGIDIAAVTSRMKVALSKKLDHQNRRRSQSDPAPPMSMHAISLLLEAVLLKAKSLQGLGRFSGVLYEAKGMHQEALEAYKAALDAEPTHVPSLISTACVLKCLGVNSLPVIKSFITDALRFDKLNHSAWYQLGLINQADPSASATDALECFEAAAMLEETAPVEPFR